MFLVIGCASNDYSNTASTSSSQSTLDSSGELVSDQPQSSIAGEGSLMPGAYDTRRMQTGQFTGRERTNDEIGQRPTLPREANPGELARSEDSLGTGAGSLGQSGVAPSEPVSAETLMETSGSDSGSPAQAAATSPASSPAEKKEAEAQAIGGAPGSATGTSASPNANVSTLRPHN